MPFDPFFSNWSKATYNLSAAEDKIRQALHDSCKNGAESVYWEIFNRWKDRDNPEKPGSRLSPGEYAFMRQHQNKSRNLHNAEWDRIKHMDKPERSVRGKRGSGKSIIHRM